MSEVKEFSDKAKKYYKGKSMRWRYIVLAILLLLLGIQLIGHKPSPSNNKNSLETVEYSSINFAGESIPFDRNYFFNQEMFDREFAIAHLNTYQFVMIHKREQQYIPYIEKKLAKAGIPDDFKYLAVAESALRNVAYSSAWAAGIRQLIPSTAERYGLIINNEVDERLDFEKSTDAAIAYLQDLYDHFNDRTLVAAAYNRWENGLQRDMDRQHMSGYYDLWLNNETARYIFRIVSLKELMQHKNNYFDIHVLGEQYKVPKTKTIKIKAIDDIATRAYNKWYSYKEIRMLNPRIKGNKLSKSQDKRKISVFK